MARRDRPVNDDGALRRYLLAAEKSVLASVLGHPWPLDGHASYEPTPEEIAENEFGKSVSALAEGRAYRLDRRALPLAHPARRVGHLGDALVLTADDELIEDR